jgi:hypothetical protein
MKNLFKIKKIPLIQELKVFLSKGWHHGKIVDPIVLQAGQ